MFLRQNSLSQMTSHQTLFIGYVVGLITEQEDRPKLITHYNGKYFELEVPDTQLFDLLSIALANAADQLINAGYHHEKFYVTRTNTGWTLEHP